MCGFDLFTLQAANLVRDGELWPQIDMTILKTIFVTCKQLKVYKYLDSHNYLMSRWVKGPLMKTMSADSVFVVSQVGGEAQNEYFSYSCSDAIQL